MKYESLLFWEGWGRSPEANLAHDAPVSARYTLAPSLVLTTCPKEDCFCCLGASSSEYSSERGVVNEVDGLRIGPYRSRRPFTLAQGKPR